MKIYKNIYLWYLLTFILLALITFLTENSQHEVFGFISAIALYLAIGFLPIGVSQVFMSIIFFVEKKQIIWLTYFIPLALWLLLLYPMNLIVDFEFLIPVYCYICHLVLYYFHTKTQKA